ncbi:unnamed protein product, partial [Rotaria sp. Silwood1]
MATSNRITPAQNTVKSLVIDPDKMPAASAPVELPGPDDRLAEFRRYVK